MINDIAATLSDPSIQSVIREAAQSAGLSTVDMPSGAVHDAGEISRIAPMGMIFVPSHDGISHNPQELTSWETAPTVWKSSTARFYCSTSGCSRTDVSGIPPRRPTNAFLASKKTLKVWVEDNRENSNPARSKVAPPS